MTSYPPEGENIIAEAHAHTSSTAPRAKAYQIIDTHNSSMVQGHSLATSTAQNYPPLSSVPHPGPHEFAALNIPPRYPESSQRILRQHDDDLDHYSYYSVASAYLDDLPNAFHANRDSISGQDHHYRPRYPSMTDATTDASYAPSFYIPSSSSLQHSQSETYQLPPMALHVPSGSQEIVDYRGSMRAYHDLQSDNDLYRRASSQSSLRVLHGVQHHNTTQDSRVYQPLPRIGAPRVISAPSDVLQNLPPHTQHRQQQQNLEPRVYNSTAPSTGHSSSSNYPSSSDVNHRHINTRPMTTTTYSAGSRSSHASSSIPMNSSRAQSSYNNSSQNARNSNRTPQNIRDGRLGYADYSSGNSNINIYPTSSVTLKLDSLARFGRHPEVRSGSTPDLLSIPFSSQPPPPLSPLSIAPNHSSLGTSDNDSVADSDALVHEDDEQEYQWHQQQQQPASTSMSMKETDTNAKVKGNSLFYGLNSKRDLSSREDGPSDTEDVVEKPLKRKKKSKMHECAVCGKKFPRPSGLKTHMNTHNNEKPFPCGFSGCTRTFGVRSNAKRHLRTHGIVATVKIPGEVQPPPYVVGFQPPVVLPPHLEPRNNNDSSTSNNNNVSLSNAGAGAGMLTPSEYPDEVKNQLAVASEEAQNGNGHHDREKEKRQKQRSKRGYKIKWMPLSLSSRANAASLREVEEAEEKEDDWYGPGSRTRRLSAAAGPWRGGGSGRGAGVKEEGEESADQERRVGTSNGPVLRLRREDDSESEDAEDAPMDVDNAGGLYSDIAAAARLSIPPAGIAFTPSVSGIELLAEASTSRLGLLRDCRCTPKCARSSSGSNPCPSLSSSSLGFSSLSPPSSVMSSFTAPSATSMSAAPPLGTNSGATLEWKKSAISRPKGAASSSSEFVEERNAAYLEFGSHPYHQSQFRGLPGPVPTNAVVPPRYPMVP